MITLKRWHFFIFVAVLFLTTVYVTVQFSVWFSRSPDLMPQLSQHAELDKMLLSPASGVVREVRPGHIRIFLSIFDLHTQYVPAGRGDFVKAISTCPRSKIQTTDFESGICVEQRPGWLARTCHSYCYAGQKVTAAQKMGAILFGSTVVITFPEHLYPTIHVKVGDRVEAIQSCLAYSSASASDKSAPALSSR